jgi:cobalt-zinc-cadmium efflux system outer membrane protein
MSILPGLCPTDRFQRRQILFGCPSFFTLALILIAGGLATARIAAANPSTEFLTLAQAEQIALTANPALASVVANAEAMATIPSQAGALPDPRLGLNAMNLPVDTFDLDQEPMTQMQVSLSQAFPFPGKRGLRREAAEHEAAAASAAIGEQQLIILGEVRATWWKLFALDRSLANVRENQGLMRDFVEIARTKYKVGAGLQQDVLLAQLELSRLLNDELQLVSRRDAAAAAFNALLDRPSAYTVHIAPIPENDHLPELPPENILLDTAVRNRPLLAGHRELIEAARDRADLAKKDYYPDFQLGAAYGFRSANDRVTGEDLPDFLSIMFSVSLPIYSGSRQDKAMQQRSKELTQRQFMLGDSLRSVEATIAQQRARYIAAREQVLLFSTAILPQAEQTVESMLAGYQVNEVDFLNVVNAELRLFNSQVSYWEALGNAKASLAQLATAVGEESLYE